MYGSRFEFDLVFRVGCEQIAFKMSSKTCEPGRALQFCVLITTETEKQTDSDA